MTNQKRKKNKITILFISLLIFLTFLFPVNANDNIKNCKKFDFKCKAEKFINDTKEFQKKKYKDGKEQLKKTIE